MNQVLVFAETFDRLRQMMAADPGGFCELYRDYLADAWQTHAALRTAFEQGQAAEFVSKAHYLKSSSLVLGIRSIAQLCAEMEEVGRTGHLQGACQKVDEAREILSLVQAELEAKLGPQVVPSAA